MTEEPSEPRVRAALVPGRRPSLPSYSDESLESSDPDEEESEEPDPAPPRRRVAAKAAARRGAAPGAAAAAPVPPRRAQNVMAPVDLDEWDGWVCARDTATEVHDKLSLTTPVAELRGLTFEELAEGIAHDENLDVVGGVVVDRFALGGEDRAVGFEEVLALHALRARAGTDEHADVGTVERNVGVVAQSHAGEQREGAVVKLHRNTLERAHRWRDLEQLQDDGLIRAEHRAAGDAEKEAVADLAGGTGHRDTNRSIHGLSP